MSIEHERSFYPQKSERETSRFSPLEKDLLEAVESSDEDWLKQNLSVPRGRDESNPDGFEKKGYGLSARYGASKTKEGEGVIITSRSFVIIPPESNRMRHFSPTVPYEVPGVDAAIKLFSEKHGPEKTAELEALLLQKALQQQEQDIKEAKWRIAQLERQLHEKGIQHPMAANTAETRLMGSELYSLQNSLPRLEENLKRLKKYQEQQTKQP